MDSFSGLSLTIRLVQFSGATSRLVEKIQYGQLPEKIDNDCESRIDEVAKNALKRKLNAWSYESEYRALLSEEFLKDNLNIKDVRLGQRIEEPLRQAIITLAKGKCDVIETRLTQIAERGVVIPTANLVPATLPGI